MLSWHIPPKISQREGKNDSNVLGPSPDTPRMKKVGHSFFSWKSLQRHTAKKGLSECNAFKSDPRIAFLKVTFRKMGKGIGAYPRQSRREEAVAEPLPCSVGRTTPPPPSLRRSPAWPPAARTSHTARASPASTTAGLGRGRVSRR